MVELSRLQRRLLTIEKGGSFTHLETDSAEDMPPGVGEAGVRFTSSCPAHVSLTLQNLQADKADVGYYTSLNLENIFQ